jgi:serine/threonine protein kinase
MTDSFGRYRIVSVLGGGSASTVYLAQAGDREVAIKTLHPHLVTDETIRRRFIREAQLVSKLIHPSIVSAEEIVESSAIPGIVMEYLPGGNLRSRGNLPAEEVARIGASIASALAYTHERGIVHRGVRPENILFDREGRAKLSDFGCAHVNDLIGLSTSTLLASSIEYIAPEVLAGAPSDARSDLYSLGVVLYEAACGVLPKATPGQIIATDRLLAVEPRWLAEIIAALVAPAGARIASARRVTSLLESHTSPQRSQTRACVHCRKRTPKEVPICLHCGGEEIRAYESKSPDAESIIIKQISEQSEVFDDFVFVLRCLAGDDELKINILTGDIRMYSNAEKKAGLRLPVRIVDGVTPADAQTLIALLSRSEPKKIHLYRRRTSELKPREKRGPLIEPLSGAPPGGAAITKLREETGMTGITDIAGPAGSIGPVAPSSVDSASALFALRARLRTLVGEIEPAALGRVSDLLRGLREERRKVSDYLATVRLGEVYAGIRRAELRIETSSAASVIDEEIARKRELIELFERYREAEREHALFLERIDRINELIRTTAEDLQTVTTSAEALEAVASLAANIADGIARRNLVQR